MFDREEALKDAIDPKQAATLFTWTSVQVLLDLGPLLPAVIQRIPRRILRITYINLDAQLEDEGQRRQQVRQEEQMRATIEVDYWKQQLEFHVRFERLQRWTLLVLDRRQRLTLRVMGQVPWPEVHLRDRAVQQESLERDHLLDCLILAQERAGRRLLRGMQGLEWANLLSAARVQRDMIVLQQQSESAMSEVARIERLCRHNLSVHILYELCGTQRGQLFRQFHRWVDSMLVWHLHSTEFVLRRGVVAQAKKNYKPIGLLRYEIKQRVQLQIHEQEDRDGVLLLSLQSECSAAKAAIASHEQLRRSMYTLAFKREVSVLQVIHHPTQNIGIYQQTTIGQGIAPRLQTLRPLGQQEVTPRSHHGSNPMPYDEYVLQWDALVGGMEQGGDALGGLRDGKYQPTQNLGTYRQTIAEQGMTGQIYTLGQTEVPPRMHHGSNP